MKIYLCVFLLSIVSAIYPQQTKRHEIYISAGVGTVPYLGQSLNHLDIDFGSCLFPDLPVSTEKDRDNVTPAVTIGYQNRISKKIRAGMEIIYDRFAFNNKEDRYRYNSFLARIDRIWKDNKRTVFYSGISAGIISENIEEDYRNIKKRAIYIAAHLYILGAEFKFKNLSLFFDSGLGVSGIINFGIKYRM